jgi:hypothetical protein
MEEFSALAARVAASVGDLRGCLILSRDGLVLGAFPEGEEAQVKPAWLRFATLGEPDKGFVEFGDEVWGYVRRGPYAAFAVTGAGARPGLLIDQLEQMLLAAEEVRARREALKIPDAPTAPSSKPRTSLHPEVKPDLRPPAPATAPASTPAPAPAPARTASSAPPPTPTPADASPPFRPQPAPGAVEPTSAIEPTPAVESILAEAMPRSETTQADTSETTRGTTHLGSSGTSPAPVPSIAATATPGPSPGPSAEEEDEPGEVDRVMLAQEFSRLLQESGDGDEG